MQHYIAIKPHPGWHGTKGPSMITEDWQCKARALRVRRERLLKQRLREEKHARPRPLAELLALLGL